MNHSNRHILALNGSMEVVRTRPRALTASRIMIPRVRHGNHSSNGEGSGTASKAIPRHTAISIIRASAGPRRPLRKSGQTVRIWTGWLRSYRRPLYSTSTLAPWDRCVPLRHQPGRKGDDHTVCEGILRPGSKLKSDPDRSLQRRQDGPETAPG